MTLSLITGDGRQRLAPPAQGVEGEQQPLDTPAFIATLLLPRRGIPMPELAHKLARGEMLKTGENIFLLKLLLAWMIEQDIDAEIAPEPHGGQRDAGVVAEVTQPPFLTTPRPISHT